MFAGFITKYKTAVKIVEVISCPYIMLLIFFTYYIPSAKFLIGKYQLLANNLFENNWSSDRIIYGCLSSLAKNLPILKFCTRGIRLIIS
jgi:hypothetical protein